MRWVFAYRICEGQLVQKRMKSSAGSRVSIRTNTHVSLMLIYTRTYSKSMEHANCEGITVRYTSNATYIEKSLNCANCCKNDGFLFMSRPYSAFAVATETSKCSRFQFGIDERRKSIINNKYALFSMREMRRKDRHQCCRFDLFSI